jgi:hypothetical protein
MFGTIGLKESLVIILIVFVSIKIYLIINPCTTKCNVNKKSTRESYTTVGGHNSAHTTAIVASEYTPTNEHFDNITFKQSKFSNRLYPMINN